MKIKISIYSVVICNLIFISLSCKDIPGRAGIAANYQPNEHIIGKVTELPQNHELDYKLQNKSNNPLYILESPRGCYYSGDTLYVEGFCSERNEMDSCPVYNVYNPPALVALKKDSLIIKTVRYEYFTKKIPSFLAIPIFNKKYIYDPKKDYSNYRSERAFRAFEKEYSYFFVIKIK